MKKQLIINSTVSLSTNRLFYTMFSYPADYIQCEQKCWGSAKDKYCTYIALRNLCKKHMTVSLFWLITHTACIRAVLPHKVKTQYLHFRSHTECFLLSSKSPEVISRPSILSITKESIYYIKPNIQYNLWIWKWIDKKFDITWMYLLCFIFVDTAFYFVGLSCVNSTLCVPQQQLYALRWPITKAQISQRSLEQYVPYTSNVFFSIQWP